MVRVRPGMVAAARPRAVQAVRHRRLATLWARRARAGRDEAARRGAAHRPAGELPQRVVPVSPAAGSDALTTVSDNGVAGVSSKAGRSKRHPRVSERHIVPNVHQNSTIATSATLNSTCSTGR